MSKIRLAIVDDDLTSRNTIKKLLENDDIYEVTADFSTGKATVEWLRMNEIDILLCDMRMPEMDGVELMRSVHIINEYIPVIAISGYDDFDFVRGSLINGAANYLLKHELTSNKLIGVLNEVRDKYRIVPEERMINNRIGYCIRDEKNFVAENIQGLVEEGKIDFSCFNVIPLVIGPDFQFQKQVNPSEYKQDICKAIMDMLAQILGTEYKYLIYFTKQAHLILLLSFKDICSTLYMINIIKNLSGRLQRQIVRLLDITVTIVSGNVHSYLEPAIIEARNMDKIVEDKLYLGGNRIVSAAVTKKLVYSIEEIPEQQWKQLRYEIENNINGYVSTLNNFFLLMENERYPLNRIQYICEKLVMLLVESNRLDNQEKNSILGYIGEFEMFEQFRDEIIKLYDQKMNNTNGEDKTYSPLIMQTIEYIYKNYANDISLEKCAELTGSSYTYLSREFKLETGLRFVEFLNRHRVNKAKSLLIRRNVSKKDIVEQTGFRNYNYFFKVFKDCEGITPSEFSAKN